MPDGEGPNRPNQPRKSFERSWQEIIQPATTTKHSGKKSKKKHIYEQAMERLFKQQRITVEQYGKPSQGWRRIVRYDPSAPSENSADVIKFPSKDKPTEEPDASASRFLCAGREGNGCRPLAPPVQEL